MPYFKDKSFITAIHQAVIRPDVQLWQTPGIKYLIQFCWAIFLRTCSAHPELVDLYADIIEDDEGILDAAIDGGALTFLQNCVVGARNFYKEVTAAINCFKICFCSMMYLMLFIST